MNITFPTTEDISQRPLMLYADSVRTILVDMVKTFMNEYCTKTGLTAVGTFSLHQVECDLLSHNIVFDFMDDEKVYHLLSTQLTDGDMPATYPHVVYSEGYDNNPTFQQLRCAWRIFLAQLEDRGYVPVQSDDGFMAMTVVPLPLTVRFISKMDGIAFKNAPRDMEHGKFTIWGK